MLVLAVDAALDIPWWTAGPFVGLLLCIALLPLVAEHFWGKNRNKLLVVVPIAGGVAAYLVTLGAGGVAALTHGVLEYASFIVLLGSLYVIAGGIVLDTDLRGRPLTNTGLLAFGAVLANAIGTTGASMLLIRPFLRMNSERRKKAHLPIFFIFIVSNLGGLLTPLGDPPLFLGLLKKVPFTWTLRLWPEWLVANGLVLLVFLFWDTLACRGEEELPRPPGDRSWLRLSGTVNFLFLAGVVAAVLAKSYLDGTPYEAWYLSEAGMVAMAVLSLLLTPRRLRGANGFTWGPILEVAILFAGIFVTMVPALELLKLHGAELGVEKPWQFFWMSGGLSSFLDNAPTYATFGTLASGSSTDFSVLVAERPEVLAAISCGAVFMGANTYIGNGPNFMVKSITEESGVRMPSFFGYMLYSGLILLPVFGLVTVLFFWK